MQAVAFTRSILKSVLDRAFGARRVSHRVSASRKYVVPATGHAIIPEPCYGSAAPRRFPAPLNRAAGEQLRAEGARPLTGSVRGFEAESLFVRTHDGVSRRPRFRCPRTRIRLPVVVHLVLARNGLSCYTRSKPLFLLPSPGRDGSFSRYASQLETRPPLRPCHGTLGKNEGSENTLVFGATLLAGPGSLLWLLFWRTGRDRGHGGGVCSRRADHLPRRPTVACPMRYTKAVRNCSRLPRCRRLPSCPDGKIFSFVNPRLRERSRVRMEPYDTRRADHRARRQPGSAVWEGWARIRPS